MRKLLVILFAIFICQGITAQDQDNPVTIEITNIPDRYFGMTGVAAISTINRGARINAMIVQNVNSNNFIGTLKYENGTELKESELTRGTRYTVILIFMKAGATDTYFYSKAVTIRSGAIKLNFRSDFYTDPSQIPR
jgi:hypothetical protein